MWRERSDVNITNLGYESLYTKGLNKIVRMDIHISTISFWKN